jgi:uncharacterized membrane protein
VDGAVMYEVAHFLRVVGALGLPAALVSKWRGWSACGGRTLATRRAPTLTVSITSRIAIILAIVYLMVLHPILLTSLLVTA